MKEEQLDEAIRALREEFPGSSARAWRTELRIVERLEGQHRRASRWRWGLPLLAVCLGSTARAANRTEVASTLRSWLAPKPTTLIASAQISKTTPVVYPEREPPTEVTPTVPVATVAPVLSAALASTVAPAIKTTLPRANPTAHPSSAAEPVSPAETMMPLTHYRTAQRFQFEQNDCESAVKSWESYLAVDPHGPLVLDARFHRAECLFRLGRAAEARAALKPFAAGEYGSYRRDAARELLKQR